MFFKFIIIILVNLNLINLCPKTSHFEINSNRYKIAQETISDFEDFNQLNFTNCKSFVNITALRIKPIKNIILDQSLDFNGFKINIIASIFTILLSNLKGIDFRLNNNLKNLETLNYFDKRAIIWRFDLSNFNFYINKKLIDKTNCNNFDFFFSNNQITSFLTGIHFLFLGQLVTYSDQTCPILFHNTIIQVISIQSISSSFINKNVFAFTQIPSNLSEKINSNILQLIINLYHYELNNSLLNEKVFEKLQVLDIEGQINSIEHDLFKSFEFLRFLRFRTQNAKDLFLTNKNKWLQSLNYDIDVDLNQISHIEIDNVEYFTLVIYQMFANVTYYGYLDEDFCYFKDFPHRKLVLPQLRPAYKLKCTCTELFLIQYSYMYENKRNLNLNEKIIFNNYYNQEYYFEEIIDKTFSYCKNINKLIEKCNFKKKLKLCNLTSINNEVDHHWYMIDWQVLSKYSYISFIFYINPILSLLSILISILNVIILTSKHLKKEIKCLYYYFNIHLIANIIFISAQYLDLLTECTYEDYFCSLFESSIYLQYFKIFGLKLIKNSLTTFSNVSYTAFILIRYTKITSSKNITLKYFEKLKLKYFILASIPFSVLINVYICFEYSLKSSESYSNQIQSRVPFDYFKINLSDNEQLILNIFQYFKIILSDLLFYFLSVCFDVSLILFIKKNINSVRSALAVGLTSKTIEKKQASKRRLTTMIILNGCNFFIFRLPLALIDVYGLIISVNLSENNNSLEYTPNLSIFMVCRYFKFCDSLQKLFYSLYTLSFLIQFFIFYKLDTNFKESIKNFL
jgi:hypothetical protein